jgi:alpha-ketoglutarate-dependent taurine dioxygenase
MMWPFGAVLDVKEHENATDHIFDSSYVPLHWDGMYKPTLPSSSCFTACTPRRRTKGAHHLHQYPPAAHRARRRAAGPLGGAHHLSHQAGGALRRPGALAAAGAHPVSGETVLRYNEPPREGCVFSISMPSRLKGGTGEQAAYQDLHQRLYDPRYFYAHQWQGGTW